MSNKKPNLNTKTSTNGQNGTQKSILGKRKLDPKAMMESGSIPSKMQKLMAPQHHDSLATRKWWEEDEENDEIKWNNLEHHGVTFMPPYKPSGVKILNKGEPMGLTPQQEEVAGWWAKYLGSDFIQQTHVKKNFQKQFLVLFEKDKIKNFDDLDFTPLQKYFEEEREKQKNRSAEEKKAEKERKMAESNYYTYCLVDKNIEKVAGHLVEPPGIFKGRGMHPAAGSLKSRIVPEYVTINVGLDDPVPKCTVPGHNWKSVVSNNEVTWLSNFRDEPNKKLYSGKYIFLSASSKFKGANDKKKYEKARRLKLIIDKIRKDYNNKMREKNDEDRQLGTATYLIDKLALRVGNEKGDDEADTVGCCSLRVQHLKLEGDRNITLDFLGKDSMRYFNTVKVDEQVYKNLKDFMHGKKKEDDLFHSINAYLIAGKLNDYLKSNMDDLSAKVFRTYNASITLQQQLDLKKEETDYEGPSDTKIKLYNDANREVAVLCNHQKTVAKNFDAQVIKMQDALKFKKERLKLLNDNMQRVKKNKEPLDYNDEKTGEKKKLPKTVEGTAKLIERLDKTIESEEYKLKSKEDNKQIALNTSKINYMDPRISVAWCKQNEVQIEKVFTKQMRAKFSWAMYIEPDWKF